MKLTLHRVLSELKVIDKRIKGSISELAPITVMKGSKLVMNPMSEDEFSKLAKSQIQSTEDLIRRKFNLRKAILNANCNTKVKIAGKEYSIYEAIEMKSIMELKMEELKRLTSYNQSVIKEYQRQVDKNEADLANQIQYFCQSAKEDAKPEIVTQLTNQMNNLNGIKILDPININDKIAELDKEINEFLVEVDSALSEINSTTTIEVED